MPAINVTVPTATIEYKTPVEKWGQVRCENCKHALIEPDAEMNLVCTNTFCPAYMRVVAPNFYCAMAEAE